MLLKDEQITTTATNDEKSEKSEKSKWGWYLNYIWFAIYIYTHSVKLSMAKAKLSL